MKAKDRHEALRLAVQAARQAGRVMQRNLRNMFHRMQLTQQDVRTWWGMVVRLIEGPRETPQTRKRQKQQKPSTKIQ